MSEGTNPRAFEIATEMALKNKSVDIALGMFDYLKKKEQPIRPHYFWPLFVAKINQNDLKGIYYFCILLIKQINQKYISSFRIEIHNEYYDR